MININSTSIGPVTKISITQKKPQNSSINGYEKLSSDILEEGEGQEKTSKKSKSGRKWLSYIENQPGKVLCTASGGYPRPKLRFICIDINVYTHTI